MAIITVGYNSRDYTTISAAVTAASNGDEIRLYACTAEDPAYYISNETATIALSKQLTLTCLHTGNDGRIAIDGEYVYRCLAITNVCVIKGVDIINGLVNEDDTPPLENGGGVAITGSGATGTVLERVKIMMGVAQYGGKGGNLYIEGASVTAKNSVISDGYADYGGNVAVVNGTLTFDDGTINNGFAEVKGGNIYAESTTANTTVNVTGGIVYNGMSSNVGAEAAIVKGTASCGVTLSYSDITATANPDSISITGGGTFTHTNGLTGSNPAFVGGAGTDPCALTSSSPCINAGVVISGITDDHLGNTRPYGATAPDMGAYEYQGESSPPPPAANFSATPLQAVVTSGTVNFTDLSTDTPTSWLWERQLHTGGSWATFSTAQNPQNITFAGIGTWDIQLTATNDYGYDVETKLEYINIIAATPPAAEFSATPRVLSAAGNVSFTDASTNTPTSWAWYKKASGATSWGTAFSTSQNPANIAFTQGAWDIKLTATNAGGSDDEIKLNHIVIGFSQAVKASGSIGGGGTTNWTFTSTASGDEAYLADASAWSSNIRRMLARFRVRSYTKNTDGVVCDLMQLCGPDGTPYARLVLYRNTVSGVTGLSVKCVTNDGNGVEKNNQAFPQGAGNAPPHHLDFDFWYWFQMRLYSSLQRAYWSCGDDDGPRGFTDNYGSGWGVFYSYGQSGAAWSGSSGCIRAGIIDAQCPVEIEFDCKDRVTNNSGLDKTTAETFAALQPVVVPDWPSSTTFIRFPIRHPALSVHGVTSEGWPTLTNSAIEVSHVARNQKLYRRRTKRIGTSSIGAIYEMMNIWSVPDSLHTFWVRFYFDPGNWIFPWIENGTTATDNHGHENSENNGMNMMVNTIIPYNGGWHHWEVVKFLGGAVGLRVGWAPGQGGSYFSALQDTTIETVQSDYVVTLTGVSNMVGDGYPVGSRFYPNTSDYSNSYIGANPCFFIVEDYAHSTKTLTLRNGSCRQKVGGVLTNLPNVKVSDVTQAGKNCRVYKTYRLSNAANAILTPGVNHLIETEFARNMTDYSGTVKIHVDGVLRETLTLAKNQWRYPVPPSKSYQMEFGTPGTLSCASSVLNGSIYSGALMVSQERPGPSYEFEAEAPVAAFTAALNGQPVGPGGIPAGSTIEFADVSENMENVEWQPSHLYQISTNNGVSWETLSTESDFSHQFNDSGTILIRKTSANLGGTSTTAALALTVTSPVAAQMIQENPLFPLI